MEMMRSLTVSFVVLFVSSHAALLQNPGFEAGINHWDCWGIHCETTTDKHSGSHAVKVTGRTQYYQGPGQAITLGLDKRYGVGGWVKLLNNNSKIVQYIEIEIAETLDGGKKNYMSVARRPFLTSHDGWVHLAGDFVTPHSGLNDARIYLQGPDPGINFLVDDMSLQEIPEITNWKAEANQRIENIRKSNIHFHVTADHAVNPSSVQLEITQTNNGFPFGSAIDARAIMSTDLADRKYVQFLTENFNWATPGNALKWYEFERNKGHPDYNWGESAIKELVKRGMNIRAHNMLWAVEQFVPTWLKTMTPVQVRAEIAKHIKDTATRYKGLVKHWDVNNELLHGNWYESKLNDKEYTKEVFQLIHQSDPDVKLFLNEYNTVGSGGTTEAYTQQGIDYKAKASTTHIYGMGVQSHFPRDIAPDPTMVKRRLDRLAQAGLPLWSTELTVETEDEHQRADWYETAFRMLFSHPAVEGIVIWGFWSQRHYAGDRSSLVSGPEFRINAAGDRYLHLIKEEWRTKTNHSLSAGSNFAVRGFHGDYEVNVKINGNTVQTEHFTLGKSDQTVNIHVHA